MGCVRTFGRFRLPNGSTGSLCGVAARDYVVPQLPLTVPVPGLDDTRTFVLASWGLGADKPSSEGSHDGCYLRSTQPHSDKGQAIELSGNMQGNEMP